MVREKFRRPLRHPDESVDVYTMVSAYRFVRDDRKFLSEMARVLAQGGIAVIPRSRGNISDFRLFKIGKIIGSLGLKMESRRPHFTGVVDKLVITVTEFLIFTK